MGYKTDVVHKGVGCRRCRNTGYAGRIGIHELLEITDTLRDAIIRGTSITGLRQLARDHGLGTLQQDGFRKIREGITTIEEVIHVAGDVSDSWGDNDPEARRAASPSLGDEPSQSDSSSLSYPVNS